MSQFTLIPGSRLKPMLAKLVSMGVQFHDGIHQFAVSAMVHACKTGDTRPLTEFYNSVLTENYQTAFKLYLRRTYRENPETDGALIFAKGEFTVVDGGHTAKEAKALAKMGEEKMLNPDGETFKRFYERNIIVESILLDDAKFATQLKALLSKAKGESDRVTSKVSKDLIAGLENLVARAQTHAENGAEHAKRKTA